MDIEQRCRWVAIALLELEQRLRRIDHPEQLPKLRQALIRELDHYCENQALEGRLAKNNFTSFDTSHGYGMILGCST